MAEDIGEILIRIETVFLSCLYDGCQNGCCPCTIIVPAEKEASSVGRKHLAGLFREVVVYRYVTTFQEGEEVIPAIEVVSYGIAERRVLRIAVSSTYFLKASTSAR